MRRVAVDVPHPPPCLPLEGGGKDVIGAHGIALRQLGRCAAQGGFTLISTLISVIILEFGLLALAGLLAKMQVATLESYQRNQAVLLVQDMVERMNANQANAASYPSNATYGTGNSIQTCGTSPGTSTDLCEWGNALLGAAETLSSSAAGGLIGARGCITTIQAQNTSPGYCVPGIYSVSVAWQGRTATVAPTNTCGQSLYGANDALRRVISQTITIGLPSC